ncbi:MAG: PQQ-dependent sugar dehydrogenase [bacterium]|nr:PQQ-dependent sugar dehydrogenase [bacterium]
MRYLVSLLVLALALAGCADSDAGPDPDRAPQVSTTTTIAPTQTAGASKTTQAESTPAESTTSTTTTTLPMRPLDEIELELAEMGSGFAQPVLMLPEPGSTRRFVVDQPGVIWAITDADTSVFLDINELVTFHGEQGLLGMAFHPDYEFNGLIYLNYISNSGDTVVASVKSEGGEAVPDTLAEILRIEQPAGNHNGGMLQFGPDGNLWIGLGDGGGADDGFGHGQRDDTMLAAMVRISVGPEIDGYTIPTGNLAGEVWAIGLRNPWRFSFDGNDLWIADVGQNRIEEIDLIDWTEGNPNFGWSAMEGTECFGGRSCDPSGYIAPIYEYTHGEGCSVTGGFVYRGQTIPELQGHYFFSDYCTGWLRSVDRQGAMREWLPAGTLSGVIGFGVDAAGELHVLTAAGSIYSIAEAG